MVIVEALGGLGIFLLGMIVLTDGLRAVAGSAVRQAIARFTRSPLSGAMTGAISTAILQSSSATTVAAVGFVSAGLLSFSSALGIIFGANIGTTVTGWLVALLGFKLNLGTVVLPLIFVGAFLRLFARDRVASFGLAIAGFGLIFVGIGAMQAAMSGVEALVQPERLPGTTVLGTLALVGIGLVLTIITQSSSAGVAIAITAVYTGTITFHQGAALVIGMDVGTTATAAMATVGASTGARRTGYSHVIYNVMTALLALSLILPYQYAWEFLAPGQLAANAEIALVAFHTLFNSIGVLAILPFTKPFARLIESLVPGEPGVTEIDRALLSDPEIALVAVHRNTQSLCAGLVDHVRVLLDPDVVARVQSLQEVDLALDHTQSVLDDVDIARAGDNAQRQVVELLHALDHLQRLHERCDEDANRARAASTIPELKEIHRAMLEGLARCVDAVQKSDWNAAARQAEVIHEMVQTGSHTFRGATIERAAGGAIDVPEATDALEAIRWLRRTSKHIARAARHLANAQNAIGIEEAPTLR